MVKGPSGSYPDSARPRHKSIRLQGYDYTQTGAYFVTICTSRKESVLGRVTHGAMYLSQVGEVVEACWNELPRHFLQVQLDAFVVMPNHVHGVLWILPSIGTQVQHETGRLRVTPGSLRAVIRSFKSAATKRLNELRETPGRPLWQPGYYERVMRSEIELNGARDYIARNPKDWSSDTENTDAEPL